MSEKDIEVVSEPPVVKVAPAAGLVDEAMDLAKAAGKKETGGLLLGTISAGPMDEIHCRPSVLLHAEEGVASPVRFEISPELQESLVAEGKEKHPDLRVVGWWHSHPGHGIFYSPWDETCHRSLFGRPGLAGLVVDPTRDERGWFGVREDGGPIEALEEEAISAGAAGVPPAVVGKVDRLERAVSGLRLGLVGVLLLVVLVGVWSPWSTEEPKEPGPMPASAEALAEVRAELALLSEGQDARIAAAEDGLEDLRAGVGAAGALGSSNAERLEALEADPEVEPGPVQPEGDPSPPALERAEALGRFSQAENRLSSLEQVAQALGGALEEASRAEAEALAFTLWNRFNFSGLRPGCQMLPTGPDAGGNFLELAGTYMENNRIRGDRRKVALSLFRQNAASFIRNDPLVAVQAQGWGHWLEGARFYAVEAQFAIFAPFPQGRTFFVPFRVVEADADPVPCLGDTY